MTRPEVRHFGAASGVVQLADRPRFLRIAPHPHVFNGFGQSGIGHQRQVEIEFSEGFSSSKRPSNNCNGCSGRSARGGYSSAVMSLPRRSSKTMRILFQLKSAAVGLRIVFTTASNNKSLCNYLVLFRLNTTVTIAQKHRPQAARPHGSLDFAAQKSRPLGLCFAQHLWKATISRSYQCSQAFRSSASLMRAPTAFR